MTTADTVKNIQQDLTVLAKSLVTLGKIEATDMAKKLGLGAALLAGALYFALNAISLLFMGGALAFFLLLQPDAPAEPQDPTMVTGALPLGFVIMACILLLVAALLAVGGLLSIRANRGVKQTQAETEATVTAVKSAIERGKADVAVRLEYGDDDVRTDDGRTGTGVSRTGDTSPVAARSLDAR
ncbi:phage holin family protein [Auraticoccus monumenti]|uniref:Putative Holin-X, holin superfamily III n=1 Tax=Auraticoccus monumenti TaxID=675864 RepID=A0A1G6S124_9ACTN|nr:phage holin family protein [Auraticoccus monumenti]SDD10622.1 Putative Holin-X, holin superfamily III [Auraticoccus monumenti]